MVFNHEEVMSPGACIKVIGIGGGGGNAVNTMVRTKIDGVQFIAANTDVQALKMSLAPTKIQLGKELTKGLGAGADPDIGRDAALEDRHAIQAALEGADMVFITAGMGGGTGTGGAAIVAQIAREVGALAVAVVTKPFSFEGKRRKRHADLGIQRLQEHVDTLITIPNQRLLKVANPNLSMIDAFRMADNVLVNAVKGISDIINVPGVINVDFADVKSVMSSTGLALMGIGIAEGEGRALEAARQAISSPLLEDVNIEGATGILINITAGENITLAEINEACSIIQEAAHEDCNIIFGAVINESLGNQIQVTVIATGFPSEDEEMDVPTQGNYPKKLEPTSYSYGYDRRRPITNRPLNSYTDRNAVRRDPVAPQRETSRDTPAKPVASNAGIQSSQASHRFMADQESAYEERPSFAKEAHDLTKMTMSEVTPSTSGWKQDPDLGLNASLEYRPIEGASLDADDVSDLGFEDTPVTDHTNSRLEREPASGKKDSESPDFLFRDLDDSINDSIERAERLEKQQVNVEGQDDDLDVPAFLRSGMKDLSLS